MKKKARVIAFYLPQYHPVPENDKTWGKGFTEWTNVGKAKPLFKGHYQPRVPADLGYYDLRLPEIREAQAQMAREAGVEGFMYWHYWFGNGKRVLERPFNEVLESGKPDFPFCLGWANHSWSTKTWVSNYKRDTMILEQRYPGEQDYIDHFYTVLPAFQDKRYIKVNDMPFFLIYAPLEFPEVSFFMDLWRGLAIKNGLKGIHFVGLSSGWTELSDRVLKLGFDAIAPGNLWNAESVVKGKWIKLIQHKLKDRFPRLFLDKYRYKDIIKNFYTEYDRKENCYPCIVPQWDRSARSGRRAVIYTGATPELFADHVKNALGYIQEKSDERKILLLRSWNEWAEGNYMEPDLEFGKGYLDVLKRCIVK